MSSAFRHLAGKDSGIPGPTGERRPRGGWRVVLRRYVTWIALLAAIILVWLQLPGDWPVTRPKGTLNTALTWAFWIL